MRARCSWSLVAAGLLVARTGLAQGVVVDTLAAKQPWQPFQAYSFPKVNIANYPELAERINKDLALDLLGVDVDTLKGALFQRVWGDAEGGLPRLNSLTWTWAQNVENVLSLGFSGETCGAYCEGFSTHYNYDLRTGERLQFDSIFTQVGSLEVKEWIGKRWAMAVEVEIVHLQDSLRTWAMAADKQEAIAASLSLYNDCLVERTRQLPYIEDLELLRTGLRVWVARCSAHVDRDADALGSVAIVLPYADIARYMRPEALALVR